MIWIICKSLLEWIDPALASCNKKKGRASSKPRSLYYSNNTSVLNHVVQNVLLCSLRDLAWEPSRPKNGGFPTLADFLCPVSLWFSYVHSDQGKKWGVGVSSAALARLARLFRIWILTTPSSQWMIRHIWVLCGISKIPGTPIANLFMHLIRRTSRVSDFKEYFAGISAKVCDSLFTLATCQPKPSCVCHVPCLLGLQSFFFWTYVTYVSNVISTRASIDHTCRTFVSVQTSKQMMLAPNIDYIQSISIVYIHSQNKSCKSLTKKGMTSVGARGLSLKSVSVRVKLGILPHFQTQVYWKSNDTWYLFILSPWRDSSSLPSYLVGPNKSVLVLCSHL